MNNKKSIFADVSLWTLIFSNFVTIYFAIAQSWNPLVLMFIYWSQGVSICFFALIKIAFAKNYTIEKFYVDETPVEPYMTTKKGILIKFTSTYVLTNACYLLFLVLLSFVANTFTDVTGFTGLNYSDWYSIGTFSLLFFANHGFSYFYGMWVKDDTVDLVKVASFPLMRMFPMHLTLIVAFFAGPALLPLFLILKTLSDILLHMMDTVNLRQIGKRIIPYLQKYKDYVDESKAKRMEKQNGNDISTE